MQLVSSYSKDMSEGVAPPTVSSSSSRSFTTTTSSSSSSSPDAPDCDFFFYTIVHLYLQSENVPTQRIPTILSEHETPCFICSEQAQRLVDAIGIQSRRDLALHDDHFRNLGNVFDPTFPSNKLRRFFFIMFRIDPTSPTPANGRNLHGGLIFNLLSVICNISLRIMTDPATTGRSNSEKEDVIISCINTATQFKHSVLIPDWLVQHGGWNALFDVADKIAQEEENSPLGTLFGATVGLSAGALVVGGLGLLTMAVSKR